MLLTPLLLLWKYDIDTPIAIAIATTKDDDIDTAIAIASNISFATTMATVIAVAIPVIAAIVTTLSIVDACAHCAAIALLQLCYCQ